MDLNRAGRAILIFVAAFCALTINYSAIRNGMPSGHYVGDFTVFWAAGQVPSVAVYDTSAITDAQAALVGGYTGPRPFVNPPSMLPWLEPFSRLPFFIALGLWMVLGLMAFLCSVRQMVGWRHVATIVIAPPFMMGLLAGQVSLFLTAALITALAILPKRPILSGALLGLAATVKPQAVLLVPLALMAGGHWRGLAAALVTGGLVGSACIAVQGPQLWLDWFGSLGPFSEIVKRHDLLIRGVTPTSIAYKIGLVEIGGQIFIWTMAVLGVLLTISTFRVSTDAVDRLAALVAGNLLCLPYAMPYDAIPLLIPGALWLWGKDRRWWLPGFLMISQLVAPLGVVAVTIVSLLRTAGGVRAGAVR